MRAAVLALLVGWCAGALAAGPAARVDLDTLIAPSATTSVDLSPDGRQLAAIRFDGVRSTLWLLDAKTLAERPLVEPRQAGTDAERRTRSPVRAEWLGNGLLAVDFDDQRSEAIDLDGRSQRPLAGRPELGLPGKPMNWAFDAGGALRAVTLLDSGASGSPRISQWYRDSADAAWQLLEEAPVGTDTWAPLFVPAEPHTLIVRSRHQRDSAALFRYDTQTRRHGELVAGEPGRDVLAAMGLSRGTLERVITDGVKPASHWFDPRWAALQTHVDAALPGRINLLSGKADGRVLVFSYADVDPGRWFVLDTQDDRAMWQVASLRPGIAPERMRPMATLEYRSADGTVIPAYLTRPAGDAAAAPLVVLVHGGPHMRDQWLWNEEVQILAAAGYAVFQPQFRGSTGFGQRFEEAGYGQWGRAMQDDITAGVQHLIEHKLADPQRICIAGASYGGYAAMWGLASTPGLYRCGISFAGVSDLRTMLEDRSDRNADPAVRELQRLRIGDPAQGAAYFDAVSPLRQAAQIQAPLLIAHGQDDVRVPIVHSLKMLDALRAQRKTFVWLSFGGEGHGLDLSLSKRRYYEAVLEFLDRHIGAGARKSGFAAPA